MDVLDAAHNIESNTDLTTTIRRFFAALLYFKGFSSDSLVNFFVEWSTLDVIPNLQVTFLLQQMFYVLDSYGIDVPHPFPEWNIPKFVQFFVSCFEKGIVQKETMIAIYNTCSFVKNNGFFEDIISNFDEYVENLKIQ